MIRSTKALATLSLLIFATLASASHAGILNGHANAFNDGNGPSGGAWTGSDGYWNGLAAPNDLIGTIDFAVFTAADFVIAFPGAAPDYVPGDALVYAYQVNNEGVFAASAEIVGISNPANTIGQFENAVGEIESSLLGFDNGGNAVWNFTNPQIETDESSYILAFSSEKVPVLGASASVTVDGGTTGIATVPTPSSVSIPEPSSALLLALGLLGFSARRRR